MQNFIAIGCTGASYYLSNSESEKVIQQEVQEVVTENIKEKDPRYGDIGSGTWLDL